MNNSVHGQFEWWDFVYKEKVPWIWLPLLWHTNTSVYFHIQSLHICGSIMQFVENSVLALSLNSRLGQSCLI